MKMEILHASKGDKEKSIDTSTDEGRTAAAGLIDSMLKGGTAIFIETEKGTYRVVGYDQRRDSVLVEVEEKNGKQKKVGRRAGKAKMTAVAPVSGGSIG